MVQPHFEYVSDGPLEGCAKMNWGSNWGYVIIIILGCYSVLVPAAVKLSLMGYNFIAMVLYPVIFVLGMSSISKHMHTLTDYTCIYQPSRLLALGVVSMQ